MQRYIIHLTRISPIIILYHFKILITYTIFDSNCVIDQYDAGYRQTHYQVLGLRERPLKWSSSKCLLETVLQLNAFISKVQILTTYIGINRQYSSAVGV